MVPPPGRVCIASRPLKNATRSRMLTRPSPFVSAFQVEAHAGFDDVEEQLTAFVSQTNGRLTGMAVS